MDVTLDMFGVGPVVVGAAMVAQLTRFAVPWKYRDLFERVARGTGENENLLHAIAWHESNLNPSAISNPNTNQTRDWGLMQINDINLARLGLTRQTALDAESSVNAAAQLLQEIRQRATSLSDIASIYNAGSNANGTARKNVDGTYVNSAYVMDVMAKYWWVQLGALAPLRTI